ncbi:hypothetical protein D3C84_710550 [compost metagenome]
MLDLGRYGLLQLSKALLRQQGAQAIASGEGGDALLFVQLSDLTGLRLPTCQDQLQAL